MRRGAPRAGWPARGPAEAAAARLRIADTMVNETLRSLFAPPNPDQTGPGGGSLSIIEEALRWSRRRLDARLELARDQNERIDALTREVLLVRNVERLLRDMEAGGGSGVNKLDVERLAFDRLELESRLVKMLAAE